MLSNLTPKKYSSLRKHLNYFLLGIDTIYHCSVAPEAAHSCPAAAGAAAQSDGSAASHEAPPAAAVLLAAVNAPAVLPVTSQSPVPANPWSTAAAPTCEIELVKDLSRQI